MGAADGKRDDRHRKHGKHSEIKRQNPASALHITAVGALDHAHLKLARQTEDGGRCQQRRNECVAVKHRRDVLEPCGQLEWTSPQFQPRVQPDGHKCHHFEQRFEGDGEHQAFVMLRGVDSSCAK